MAEYWGLRRIADRMGWKDERTAISELKNNGFPIYKRRRGKHLLWFTEDSLIQLWELQRVKINREELREKLRIKSKNQERGLIPSLGERSKDVLECLAPEKRTGLHEETDYER